MAQIATKIPAAILCIGHAFGGTVDVASQEARTEPISKIKFKKNETRDREYSNIFGD